MPDSCECAGGGAGCDWRHPAAGFAAAAGVEAGGLRTGSQGVHPV